MACLFPSCGYLKPWPEPEPLPPPVPEIATPQEPTQPVEPLSPQPMTVQIGAFRQKERAEKWVETLKSQGVDTSVSQAANGFWTVRTGNFKTFQQARDHGIMLQSQEKIEDFFVVDEEPVEQDTSHRLRENIVITAQRFLGTKYRWGGTSKKWGVDCSGLTWIVFREHGIELPRNASQQFRVGEAVAKKDLQKGDLVFFSTNRRKYASHVGIYSGDGQFIHASVTDKRVRPSSLSNAYFKRHFIGARRLVKTP